MKINHITKKISQSISLKMNDETKKQHFIFNIVTLSIIGIIIIFGCLYLTRHLGDALYLFTFFTRIFVTTDEGIPKPFDAYHWIWLAILAVIGFLIIYFGRKGSELTCRIILFAAWAIFISFEIFKQFLYIQDIKNGVLVYGYHWMYFPFQFCSTPFYVLPFIIYLKDGRVRNAIIGFSTSFMLIGGLAGTFYPTYCTYRIINVHTMIHHGLMVIIAIYLAVYYRSKLNFKTFLTSIIPFAVALVIAFTLNEVVWQNIPSVHSGSTEFNMFFISPHFISKLPIFSLIQPNVPYPVFAMIYIVGFIFVAYLVTIIYSLIINHKIKPCFSLKNI